MFQSTVNPELATGLRSRYAEKNYFMISKHFLSLNSRLGYHFSILEALVGDRPSENYVSFQFKGGAADMGRRTRRIELIGGVLETHGFRVSLTGDHLIARFDGEPSGVVEKRLEILGYLTLHTRQIDMIMSNPSRVRAYEEKIQKDIEQIVAPS